MYANMYSTSTSRNRTNSDSSDDDIETDCATYQPTNPSIQKLRFQSAEGDLISRDASCSDSKSMLSKLSSDPTRCDSHVDSGFISFPGENLHSVGSGGDSAFGYTRLQSVPVETVSSPADPSSSNIISSCYIRPPASSEQIGDYSSNASSYSSSSSSDISDKIGKLSLAHEKYSSLSSEQHSAGAPFIGKENEWCKAFQQDEDGDTVLHLAIIHMATKVITNLINNAPHPVFLNLQNNLHQTPLHLAVLLNLSAIVRKLIVHGAILNIRDRRGNTALHLACYRGYYECVLELLNPITYQELSSKNLLNLPENWDKYQQPRDLDLRNYEGQTCIHLATFCKSKEILSVLIQNGANVNAQEGKSGRSALHYAVEMEDFELLHYLVKHGKANLNAKTFAGLTPIQFGYIRNMAMVNALKQFGAEDDGPPMFSDYESSESDSSMDESIMVTDQECDFMFNGEPLSSL